MSSSTPDDRIKVLIAMEGVLGGTLRHLDYLLRFTDPREFDVHLAVSAHRAPHVRAYFRRWIHDGRRVHEVAMRREISPDADLRALRRFTTLCRRERFDVVHTHCAKAGFLGRMAARAAGARTIHTPHVFPFSHVGGPVARELYLALERLAARWTNRFVLLSNYQLNVLLDARLADADRAALVPNGIVPEEFVGPSRDEARRQLSLPAEAPIALFAGRFREQKGLDVLVEAASCLEGAPPDLQIVIVGEGPLGEWLEEQIEARGLAERVIVHGLADAMAPYYAACDVVVMPSRAEGMPYVLLEAKAAGRPAVASLVSGMEEFIEHGRDGWLVPPENPDALAGTMAEVLCDRAATEQAGRRARESLRPEWHAGRTAEHIQELYRALAEAD